MNKPKIFIDAGHNYSKYDTGAQGNGLKEQNVTFEIGIRLKKLLSDVGFNVKISRETKETNLGTTLNSSLAKRVSLAESFKADYFISLHCNAAEAKSANGTETYIYSNSSKSKPLAALINNNICKDLGTFNRGVKENPSLYVLRKTSMPSMLVETGFITNAKDAEKLKKYDAYAKSICESICGYFGISDEKPSADESNPKTNPEPFKYHIEGITHVIEADPANIWAVETQKATNQTPYNNFVNSIFFMAQANGVMYPQGIMVNAGKVLCNNATHGKPVAALIIHSKDDVEMKYVTDITKEKDVWFAVSGYGIYPNITAEKEGFTGKFGDVTRMTSRPIIGYRKKDNKIVIAVRSNSSAERANQTAKNLGLDFAISLDGGGSTTLKVNGSYKFTGDGRKLYGGIIWA